MLRTVMTTARSGDLRHRVGNDIDLRPRIDRRRGAERGRELLHGITGRWDDDLRARVVELRGDLRNRQQHGRRVALRPCLRSRERGGSQRCAGYDGQQADSG